jgi:formyl-CoA transferase
MILIGANGDNVFARLAEAMGEPELAADPRYCDHASRGANQHELDARIAGWTRARGLDELLPRLAEHGVPASRLYRAPDMLADPQFAAREAIVSTDHPVLGPIRMQNVFPRLSATPGEVRWPGPELGEHTAAVLCDRAGCPPERIAELRDKGVI